MRFMIFAGGFLGSMVISTVAIAAQAPGQNSGLATMPSSTSPYGSATTTANPYIYPSTAGYSDANGFIVPNSSFGTGQSPANHMTSAQGPSVYSRYPETVPGTAPMTPLDSPSDAGTVSGTTIDGQE